MLTSSRAGKLTQWDITGIDVSPAASAAAAAPAPAAAVIHGDVSKEAWLASEHPDSAVDCVRFLTGGDEGRSCEKLLGCCLACTGPSLI